MHCVFVILCGSAEIPCNLCRVGTLTAAVPAEAGLPLSLPLPLVGVVGCSTDRHLSSSRFKFLMISSFFLISCSSTEILLSRILRSLSFCNRACWSSLRLPIFEVLSSCSATATANRTRRRRVRTMKKLKHLIRLSHKDTRKCLLIK